MYPILIRVLAGVLIAFALSACDSDGPTEAPLDDAPEILWEVPGALASRPIIIDSLVVTAFTDGRLAAFHRGTGAQVWVEHITGLSRPRLLRSGDALLLDDGWLQIFDAHRGYARWGLGESQPNRLRWPTTVISGSTMYTAQSNTLAARDAVTGIQKWSTLLPWGTVTLGPALSDNLVLVPVQFPAEDFQEPFPVFLIAYDRGTGSERWRVSLPDASEFSPSVGAVVGAVVAGDRVLVGTRAGRVLAFGLSDGKELWNRGSGESGAAGYNTYAPVLHGGLAVFVRTDGVLEARVPSNGEVQWTLPGAFARDPFSPQLQPPVPCAPYLCAVDGDRLVLIDAAGRIAWQTDPAVFRVNSSPAVDSDGTMYVWALYSPGDARLVAMRGAVRAGATP